MCQRLVWIRFEALPVGHGNLRCTAPITGFIIPLLDEEQVWWRECHKLWLVGATASRLIGSWCKSPSKLAVVVSGFFASLLHHMWETPGWPPNLVHEFWPPPFIHSVISSSRGCWTVELISHGAWCAEGLLEGVIDKMVICCYQPLGWFLVVTIRQLSLANCKVQCNYARCPHEG